MQCLSIDRELLWIDSLSLPRRMKRASVIHASVEGRRSLMLARRLLSVKMLLGVVRHEVVEGASINSAGSSGNGVRGRNLHHLGT